MQLAVMQHVMDLAMNQTQLFKAGAKACGLKIKKT